MKRVLDIWKPEMSSWRGLTLKPKNSTHCRSPAERTSLARTTLILKPHYPDQQRTQALAEPVFKHVGEATRWIRSTLLVVVLTVAGILIPFGILLTQRMVSQVDRAEANSRNSSWAGIRGEACYMPATTRSPIWLTAWNSKSASRWLYTLQPVRGGSTASCTWTSISSKSSTIPADMPAEINCCGR